MSQDTHPSLIIKTPAISIIAQAKSAHAEEKPAETISPNAAISTPSIPCLRLQTAEAMSPERRLRLTELGLRIAVLGLGLAAAALVGSDSQVRKFFSMEKRAKFTDMKILVFLLAANAVAAGYNLLQIVRCLLGMMKGSFVFNKGLALIIFSCDQVVAYVTLSAAAAAVQSGMVGQFGQPELQWMKICNLYKSFCTQVGEGLGSALMASFAMIIVSCISSFNLFRLFGNKKSNASW